jgi:hypothetical protein
MNFIRPPAAGFTIGNDNDCDNCKKCIVLAEQSVNRVAILDLDSKKIVWEWK